MSKVISIGNQGFEDIRKNDKSLSAAENGYDRAALEKH